MEAAMTPWGVLSTILDLTFLFCFPVVLQENESRRKTLDLQIRFCSFLVLDSSR